MKSSFVSSPNVMQMLRRYSTSSPKGCCRQIGDGEQFLRFKKADLSLIT